MKGEGNGLALDDKTSLILIATNNSKSAFEVSRDCNLPLSTTYRRLEFLLEQNLVKVSGEIENGKRHLLFTNNSKENHFKNSQRALTIMNIIASNPGISFRGVLRQSGLTNGVLSHYLLRLQEKGLLFARRTSRKVWLFTSDIQSEDASLIIQVRNETARSILQYLLDVKSASFYDLTVAVPKCPASVSIRLSRLVHEGFIKRTGSLRKTYTLRDPRTVARAMARASHWTGARNTVQEN